jgi:O-antigen ligase
MASLGAVFLLEGASGALIYRTLRDLIGDPIRPDLAVKNVAQGGFILAVLWPPAALAALRVGAPWWLGLLMTAGLAVSSIAFGSDAPLLALGLAVGAGAATLRWPVVAPRILAGLVAAYFLAAPLALVLAKTSGLYARIEALAPLSWSQRMGYWSHAVRWTREHPLRGWGLDASRSFAPGIKLHPHDAALQVWLELGLVGAVCMAVFWAVTLLRLSRRTPDAAMAAGVAAAVSYLTFAAVSFGVWQEWWLATGVVAAAFVLAVERQAAPIRIAAARGASTSAPISE